MMLVIIKLISISQRTKQSNLLELTENKNIFSYLSIVNCANNQSDFIMVFSMIRTSLGDYSWNIESATIQLECAVLIRILPVWIKK